ncbi:outer membrane protein [Ketogulonicigenium robustum]|uniref:Outer membrane protein assembly factor BamA n=1 Tax=Ketogulonicigenium robustum TaxID=92947 RepID=A0A1W6NYL1_9RHOB|nr:outer membrane protein assembly factor BamA [Ketogulonicigenium robustum]ARO14346.1 outer membrane protein [Ketogulonicigenium robustum]
MSRVKVNFRRNVALVALVTALQAIPAVGQQSFVVNAITVQGNQRIETGTIVTQLGLARGQAVSAADVNDAIQKLRTSGLFENVDADLQGGTLVVRVQEYPTINRINFEGNERISDEQLAGLINSTARRVFNPAQAADDASRIVMAYGNEGRINATVNPVLINRSDNRVDLVFEIAESAVTEIERISFVGNSAYSDGRLRRVLDTKEAGLLRALIRRDTYSPERINVDRRLLTDFYNSRGYADFRVQNVDVALTQGRDAYMLTFNVEEGPRYRIGNVTISSALPEADAKAFEDVLRLSRGDVYSPTNIDNDVQRIENQALRLGLNFVRVDPVITRDPANLRLNVEYKLVRGERLFIERIDIEGNTTTLHRVVRSQFTAVEGDPFNPRAIRESAARIRALGFFSDAQVNVRPGTADDRVVVDVDVVEQPTGSASFGVNFGSDDGMALIASYQEQNFLGRGQNLGLTLSTGETNRVLSFSFAEPALMGRDLRGAFDFSYRRTNSDYALYDTNMGRLSPSLQFPVSERGRLTLNYGLTYGDIIDVYPTASKLIKDEAAEGERWTNSVGYTYTWDSRRNGVEEDTSFGFRFSQDFGFGDNTFIRTSALATAQTAVWGGDLILRATLEGGYLHYTDGASRLTDRYFMGSRVMRGFAAGGIGPRDGTLNANGDIVGDALGGNAYAVLRLETEFPLGLPEEYGIKGGTFIDYGSLWDVGKQVAGVDILSDDFIARAVAGVSLFWDTPLGPLRFNFSKPLMVEDYDNTRNFELTVSTSF